MNNINIHRITSITVGEPRLIRDTQDYVRDITVYSEAGDLVIALYSDDIEGLEFMQVKAEAEA